VTDITGFKTAQQAAADAANEIALKAAQDENPKLVKVGSIMQLITEMQRNNPEAFEGYFPEGAKTSACVVSHIEQAFGYKFLTEPIEIPENHDGHWVKLIKAYWPLVP
jgi:hypothetical protein